MPIEIRIGESELIGFSDPAKNGVQTAGVDFLKAVIAEANRLESAHKSGGGPVEITQAMVVDAVVIQRRSLGARKTPIGIKILRIATAVVSLVVGFMYDGQKLQDAGYMAVFILLITIAVGLTIISTMKE